MTEINFNPTPKQFEAWEILNDNTTTELLWGGASSGGKSFMGCAWLIISCIKYPGSRWLMGRSKLSALKSTTLKTFNDIIKLWNIEHKIKINHQSNTILFDNGSEIMMKDLFHYPSDDNFDSLGSMEISGAFCDESSQISYKAIEILQTRIRYKLKEFGIIPKLLMTCNPSHGFLYTEFYKPWVEGTLKPYRKFMPVLATDNPHTDPNYITQLKKASESVQQRLLHGSWNFSQSSDALFRYEHLSQLTSNINITSQQKFITADIARLGRDKTIIMIWSDLTIIDIIEMEGVTTDISSQKIIELARQHNILYKNIIIDSDGIGGGVVDQIRGVYAFINNGRPLQIGNEVTNYTNLKSQCYYKLAEYVEKELIKIRSISSETFEMLCQELQVIKQKDIDKDGKLAVIPKDEMKKIIGRSPDYADCMMMRMVTEFKLRFNADAVKIYF